MLAAVLLIAAIGRTARLEKKKPVVFCGDLNVAHTELDLANPKPNRGKKGFTDEETKAIARNHVGEIDISLAQPIAADPYQENPRTGGGGHCPPVQPARCRRSQQISRRLVGSRGVRHKDVGITDV